MNSKKGIVTLYYSEAGLSRGARLQLDNVDTPKLIGKFTEEILRTSVKQIKNEVEMILYSYFNQNKGEKYNVIAQSLDNKTRYYDDLSLRECSIEFTIEPEMSLIKA